jgi:hypothetical protein
VHNVTARDRKTKFRLKIERETTESSSKTDYYNIHNSIFGHSLSTYKIYEKAKTEYRYKTNKDRGLKFEQINFLHTNKGVTAIKPISRIVK